MWLRFLLLLLIPLNVSAEVSVVSFVTHQIEVQYPDAESLFGGVIPADGFRALLVYSSPANACMAVQPPPKYENVFHRWILLIQRHDCNFDVKVRNAERAGYDLAIVHNVNSTNIQPMGTDNPFGISIPSLFVGSDAGEALKLFFQYNHGYYITVTVDRSNDLTMQLLMIFAILIGICFLCMVSFIIYKWIQDRRRAMRHRLPKSSLKQIPVHKFKKSDPYEMCAICLEEYQEQEKLRVLPCLHAYHMKCIDRWLTKNSRACPICKRRVFASSNPNSLSEESDMSEDEQRPLLGSASNNAGSHQTFITQPENPFQRARRHFLQRAESISSSINSFVTESTTSSMTSSLHSANVEVEETRSLLEEPSVNA